MLSNSLVRKFHPYVLEDPNIYYVEHLVLDFHEDKIEKLGNFPFFAENDMNNYNPVSYTHLRAHETKANLVCRLLLEKKKKKKKQTHTKLTNTTKEQIPKQTH